MYNMELIASMYAAYSCLKPELGTILEKCIIDTITITYFFLIIDITTITLKKIIVDTITNK